MGKRSPEETERRLERLKAINKIIYEDYQRSLENEDELIYPYEEPIRLLSDDELRVFAEGENTGIDEELADAEVYHNYHNAFLELQTESSTKRPFDPTKDNDLERIAPTILDLSYVNHKPDSEEYNQIVEKNKTLLEELKNSPQKRKEVVENKLKQLLSLDLTPILTGSDAEKVKFCKEHPVEVDSMFLISDMTSYYQSCKTNHGLQIDEGLLLACQEKTKIMQSAGAEGALAEGFSNEFYPLVAGKSANTLHAIADTLPEWISQLNGIGEARNATYGEGSAEKEFDLMMTKFSLVGDNKKIYELTEKDAFKAMADLGLFKGGPLKYAAFDETGKEISIEDAAKTMYNDGVSKSNKLTFWERTPEEINYLSNGGKKPQESYTGVKIKFEGFKGILSYEDLSKEQIEAKTGELKNTFTQNPNRIEKPVTFSEEGKEYGQVLGEYFNELNRVKDVFDNHLKTVSKDENVNSENYVPVINKISKLEEAFLATLGQNPERENAQNYFSNIKQSVKQFSGYVQGIKEGESVKDFNLETFLKPMTTIGDSSMLLKIIAENQTNLTPEKQELLKTIVSQIDILKLKNSPDNPKKDMLGIPKDNIIDACSAKYLMPLKLSRQLAVSYTTDGNFPKDPEGFDAFKKLEDQIVAFDKKASDMYFKKEGANITKEDYINVAKALKNVAENGPLFAGDCPNVISNNTQSINQAVKYSKSVLSEMAQLFPDVPEIVEIAKSSEASYVMNCKKEYQRLQKEAFKGDVVNDPKAKEAWSKMTILKNQYKDLDNQYQKDRMAMMVINNDFCLQQVANAENILNRIEKNGITASITNENRMLTVEDSMSAENRTRHMAEVRNDAIMTQMFGIGLSNERKINSNPKATEEERFIGGNEKLKSIAEKDSAAKYKYAKQRTEAFLSHRKDLKELNPKVNENLKETTKALKGTLGYEGYKADNKELKSKIRQLVSYSNDSLNLDAKRLSSIIKKGTPEANALRGQITSYCDKAKNGETITIDDKMTLFKASRDYLHKKSSIPMTQFGKNRVDAATEIMGKVGRDILSDSNNAAAFNTVRTEIEIEMLRNPKFRKEMTDWAKEVINKNVALGKNISKDNPELLAASELLVFGKAADSSMPDPKKNYIDTKLDKPEKMNMIINKVAGIAANAKTLLNESLQNGLEGLQNLANEKAVNHEDLQITENIQAINI